MVNRIIVTLEQPEYVALLDLAVDELRSPRDQLRYLLRKELDRLGLLSPTNSVAQEHNRKGRNYDTS